MTEVVKFSIPKSVKSNEPMFKSLQDMIVVTLMAPHLSIEGAKKIIKAGNGFSLMQG